MKKILMMIILVIFLFGCAGIPVRRALQENINVSPGRVEGNQFTGIRYSFNVSVPGHWKVTTEFPDFLEQLGTTNLFRRIRNRQNSMRIIPKRNQISTSISRRRVGMQDSTRKESNFSLQWQLKV